MQNIARIKLPVPAKNLQLYVRNRELVPNKKQIIATVIAKNPSGATLRPHLISWTFSTATNSPYCYVPPMEKHGNHLLKLLEFDDPVAEVTVQFAPWGAGDESNVSAIESLHYACSPCRSSVSTEHSLSVAGVADMEVVA